MATRWARFARGWLAAVVATFVAAFSHAVAGGGVPSALAIVLSLAFSGMVCVALAGRTLSRVRLAASVLLSQLAFHSLFMLGGSTLRIGGAVAHDHTDPIGSFESQFAAHSAAAEHSQHLGGDQGMVMAHVVAAILTFFALRHGEHAFWSLFASARLSLGVLLDASFANAPVDVPPSVPSAGFRVFVPRELRLVLSRLRHRGPPLRLALSL
ncbi:hypothetical protein [Compostimonas suwonensis]|uniref:Uncharacterized protein n=1 Tax=Compostimonas suwonensis TaxID=1048394 RepID=A0A2M9C4S2_9MICO|nr:hypothetical protein [Compostimonas suwonensis]PJJ65528.1 hypothetical protein CLV54_0561 [Compostimonas suwonensis]